MRLTFGGKKYDTSSKLNNVPPIGAPKATATPAAHAALRISRRLAVRWCQAVNKDYSMSLTFVIFVFCSDAAHNIAYAARYMDERTLFPQRQSRCNRKSKTNRFREQNTATKVSSYDKSYLYAQFLYW